MCLPACCLSAGCFSKASVLLKRARNHSLRVWKQLPAAHRVGVLRWVESLLQRGLYSCAALALLASSASQLLIRMNDSEGSPVTVRSVGSTGIICYFHRGIAAILQCPSLVCSMDKIIS